MMNDRYLMHYGVKGMKWGIRHDRERNDQRNGAKRYQLSKKQKRILLVGASAVAAGLVVYGGYKTNNFLNKENMKIAATIGKSFGDKFGNTLSGTVTGVGPANNFGQKMLSKSIGQEKSISAGNQLGSKVSERVYNSNKGIRKIGLYAKGRSLNKGKKTPYDIVDYNKTVKSILKDQDVIKSGQSLLSKNIRDALRNGGQLPKELKYW